MKITFALASIALLSGFAHASTKELSFEVVQVAQLMRSSGVQECFELVRNGEELSFESITVADEKTSSSYIVSGSRITGGDMLQGQWEVEIKKTSSANPEEGSTVSCQVLVNKN